MIHCTAAVRPIDEIVIGLHHLVDRCRPETYLHAKNQLDWISRFCTIHDCYDRFGQTTYKKYVIANFKKIYCLDHLSRIVDMSWMLFHSQLYQWMCQDIFFGFFTTNLAYPFLYLCTIHSSHVLQSTKATSTKLMT